MLRLHGERTYAAMHSNYICTNLDLDLGLVEGTRADLDESFAGSTNDDFSFFGVNLHYNHLFKWCTIILRGRVGVRGEINSSLFGVK